jgi:ABC-type molybdate transport system permease subunit
LENRARFFCGFGIVGCGEIGEKSGMDVKFYFLSMLGCSAGAMLIAFVAGVPLAWISLNSKNPLVRIVKIALMLPLIFPPTVIALLLVLLNGTNSPCVGWIITAARLSPLLWTIAAAVLALPVVYYIALNAFRSIEGTLLDIARIYGVAEFRSALSQARNGLVLAVVCGFVRAFAEFHILMVIPSLMLFSSTENGNPFLALLLLFSILATAVSVVALMKSPCHRR